MDAWTRVCFVNLQPNINSRYVSSIKAIILAFNILVFAKRDGPMYIFFQCFVSFTKLQHYGGAMYYVYSQVLWVESQYQ